MPRELAQVAQSVEQRTENPRVGGSIPPLGTIGPSTDIRQHPEKLRIHGFGIFFLAYRPKVTPARGSALPGSAGLKSAIVEDRVLFLEW